MSTMKAVGLGLFVVVVLCLGIDSPRLLDAAPNCTTKCSETQYYVSCAGPSYVYLTKSDCTMCSGGTTYYDDRSLPDNCEDVKETIKLYVVTNTNLCPYTVGAVKYTHAEANSVPEPKTGGTDTFRKRCILRKTGD